MVGERHAKTTAEPARASVRRRRLPLRESHIPDTRLWGQLPRPHPAVPGWYKHPYQVEGCGKPALQKTKTAAGARSSVCILDGVYIRIPGTALIRVESVSNPIRSVR